MIRFRRDRPDRPRMVQMRDIFGLPPDYTAPPSWRVRTVTKLRTLAEWREKYSRDEERKRTA